jgi:hypothetical protein
MVFDLQWRWMRTEMDYPHRRSGLQMAQPRVGPVRRLSRREAAKIGQDLW